VISDEECVTSCKLQVTSLQKEVRAYCIRPYKQKIKRDRMNPIFIEMTNVGV